MPWARHFGKLYPMFTLFWSKIARWRVRAGDVRSERMVVGIAAMMFVWLFGWGQEYFHWSDPTGKIQLALFASFVLGIVCGYKTKQ
jgi:hypothetical protein